jgi:hypothetical protein
MPAASAYVVVTLVPNSQKLQVRSYNAIKAGNEQPATVIECHA